MHDSHTYVCTYKWINTERNTTEKEREIRFMLYGLELSFRLISCCGSFILLGIRF